ncbi:anti-sigma regulatory factor [Aetokthonos hydrillicola Thurmond2011]|uniref:Anti-sigma regulatory factor n=1 Tax=Aetokthonos hydrillicola Thurmond2011 TaxID=2712845 RepID=A0AAP5MCK0_9CYAN|nr:anti-sigma regulatory factor [Aetokthonos hydrillicola]MBO3462646.1 anti-sigma regulatory factor [Aetokthonos hydrillicola CCALA 1050]MBW4585778.1 anti-sigma regulatory factor [Aetokthonos hydrillicola CCALA 1050]MDR9899282.1 anti-sigma regulatory factor [Aetokthonos hydrillicola Thurmond2011]
MKTELHVPSDLKFVTVVENWLLGSLEIELKASIDWMSLSNRLRLALVEAYSNVVRHAHKDQPYLPVIIRLELKQQYITIEIWDYGEGYDINEYSPPSPTEKQEGGYGWMIIHRLMDKVDYQLQINGCNCLKLEASTTRQR